MRAFFPCMLLSIFLTGILVSSGTVAQESVKTLQAELQKPISDTLKIGICNRLAQEYSASSLDTTLLYIKTAEPMVKKYPHSTQSLQWLYIYGRYWLKRDQMERAEGYFKQLMSEAIKAGKTEFVYKAKYKLAENEHHRGNHAGALAQLMKLEKEVQKSGQNSPILKEIYTAVSSISSVIGDHKRSDEYIFKVLPFCKNKSDSLGFYYTLHFQRPRESKENLKYALIALNLANQLQDYHTKATLLNNIGDYYLGQKDYVKALDYMHQAISIAQSTDNHNLKIYYISAGEAYLEKEEFSKAIEFLNKSISVQEANLEDKRMLGDTYALLAEAYNKFGNLEASYKTLVKADKIMDERAGEELEAVISQMNEQYELSEKEEKIAIQEAENSLQQTRIETERNGRYFLVSALVILLGLFLWAVYNFLLQRRLSSALAEEKTTVERQADDLRNLNYIKDRMFSTLGHDLRSPITELHEMLGLWKNPNVSQKEKQSLTDYLYYRVHNLRNILENLLFWGVVQLKHANVVVMPVGLDAITKQLCEQVKELLEHKQLTLINRVRAVRVHTDEQQLMIILRNIMTNAIKFTPPNGVIQLSLEEVAEGGVWVHIQDTGLGMDAGLLSNWQLPRQSRRGTAGEQGSGLGLHLCHELATQLNIRMEIRSQPIHGTTVSLFFSKNQLVHEAA